MQYLIIFLKLASIVFLPKSSAHLRPDLVNAFLLLLYLSDDDGGGKKRRDFVLEPTLI